jgi:hypothetical protein
VNLEKLLNIIYEQIKQDPDNQNIVDYLLSDIDDAYLDSNKFIRQMTKKFNPLKLAEVTYNTDKGFSLILKFYRPNIIRNEKKSADKKSSEKRQKKEDSKISKKNKTTIKILKKGKVNFDGGNSEIEILELYEWVNYMYYKYRDEIILDINTIKNEYDSDTSDTDAESIYDHQEDNRPIEEILITSEYDTDSLSEYESSDSGSDEDL